MALSFSCEEGCWDTRLCLSPISHCLVPATISYDSPPSPPDSESMYGSCPLEEGAGLSHYTVGVIGVGWANKLKAQGAWRTEDSRCHMDPQSSVLRGLV